MIGVVRIAMWVAVLSVLGGAAPSHKLRKNANKRLSQQEQDLKELGCKPTLQKINVKSLLDTQDPLRDEDLFPQVVAIQRCQEDCGFCGWHKKGVETKRCVTDPKKVKEKLLVVYYLDRAAKRMVYVEVTAKEHTACMCTKQTSKEKTTSTQSPQTSTPSRQTSTESSALLSTAIGTMGFTTNSQHPLPIKPTV